LTLMRKFNQDFKFEKNGTVRNWGAMNEEGISALYELSKKKGLGSIEKFSAFDFHKEITQSEPNRPDEESK
jgi:hypothetical protein